MHINLDRILDRRPPWDLTLTLGGKTYQTRELDGPKLKQIHALASRHDDAAAAELLKIVFGDDAPPLESVDQLAMGAAAIAIGMYVQQRTAWVADEVRASTADAVRADRHAPRSSATPRRTSGGVVQETFTGEQGLAQLDQFMVRTGGKAGDQQ